MPHNIDYQTKIYEIGVRSRRNGSRGKKRLNGSVSERQLNGKIYRMPVGKLSQATVNTHDTTVFPMLSYKFSFSTGWFIPGMLSEDPPNRMDDGVEWALNQCVHFIRSDVTGWLAGWLLACATTVVSCTLVAVTDWCCPPSNAFSGTK